MEFDGFKAVDLEWLYETIKMQTDQHLVNGAVEVFIRNHKPINQLIDENELRTEVWRWMMFLAMQEFCEMEFVV